MSTRYLIGDCREVLKTLAAESVHCVVTSPPYWGLRDYGVGGQIGLEATYTEYVETMVAVFREVRRVLRHDGTVWLNLGDSYSNYRVHGGGAMPGQTVHNGELRGKPSNLGGLADDDAYRVNNARRSTRQLGLKEKDLCGIPWRVAFALQADGWYLRQDIIWSKPNPMPESVTDRCTKAHEYVFLLSKSARYYYDAEAIKEAALMTGGHGAWGGRGDGKRDPQSRTDLPTETWSPTGKRNKRSVWEIATAPFSEAHFATFPPSLIEPCILAGCPLGGTVLDPFSGAGTTGLVADRLQRNSILIELNPEYAKMAERRVFDDAPLFAEAVHGAA